MDTAKIFGYVVSGLFVLGVAANFKDIRRYIRIASM